MRDAPFITKPRFVGDIRSLLVLFRHTEFWYENIITGFLQDFAINLENKVFSINEALQMKSLTFVIDACKILAQARKVCCLNTRQRAFYFAVFSVVLTFGFMLGIHIYFDHVGSGLLVCIQLLQPGY